MVVAQHTATFLVAYGRSIAVPTEALALGSVDDGSIPQRGQFQSAVRVFCLPAVCEEQRPASGSSEAVPLPHSTACGRISVLESAFHGLDSVLLVV